MASGRRCFRFFALLLSSALSKARDKSSHPYIREQSKLALHYRSMTRRRSYSLHCVVQRHCTCSSSLPASVSLSLGYLENAAAKNNPLEKDKPERSQAFALLPIQNALGYRKISFPPKRRKTDTRKRKRESSNFKLISLISISTFPTFFAAFCPHPDTRSICRLGRQTHPLNCGLTDWLSLRKGTPRRNRTAEAKEGEREIRGYKWMDCQSSYGGPRDVVL